MRHISISIIFLLLFSFLPAAGQTTQPEPADRVLKAGIQQAESSNKTVFLIFHASWCGWCKRLEAALENPALKKLMDDNYVFVRLDVLESGDKVQKLENPGGKAIMNDFGGEQSGLPFYAFLDATGKKIADSNVMPKNQNIGYPGSAEEIAAFEKLLKATAPRMTEAQRTTIVTFLQKNAPH